MVLYCPNPRVRRALGGSVEAERGSLHTPLVLPCSRKNAICSDEKIFERSSFARGRGPCTKALDANRSPRAMGRRRDAGHRPEAFARASASINTGHGNGKTWSALNGYSPFIGAARGDVVRQRWTSYHGSCPYHTMRSNHASPTSARIAAGPGNPVDHGNRVRHVVACAAFDRTVSMVGRPGRTTGTAAPTSPAQDRRSNNGNPGNLWQHRSMMGRPFIDKNSEKSIALPDVPGSVQRRFLTASNRGHHDASQPDR